MRVRNSIKNIYMSLFSQVFIIFLGFMSRKVFIDNLGTEYLGINGLLSNIISMMSLVEGGIGVSITYNLYKPLAENNKEKIISLIQLYKKLYFILANIILIIGIILYPLINKLIIKSSEIRFIGLVYFIFVIKNMISYINAHKWSLINADQKGYIIVKYNLLFTMISTISKIAILIITSNYILYLFLDLIIFLIQNIVNGSIVNKRYSYIKTNKKYKVDIETKKNLISNVKALFLHNIGSWAVLGTDNILITKFINIATVGLYSNYTMITAQLTSLINPIINSLGASVGNLLVTEDENKNYEIFNVIYFINFWVYSFVIIFLFNLLEPFINWWLGSGLLLDKFTFTFILINLYLMGMRASVIMFKSKAGIFVNDKYIALIEAIVNLVVSIVLVKKIGLVGVFIGTTVSTITIPFIVQSKLIYKYIFKKPSSEYFKKYLFYIFITISIGILTTFICRFIEGVTLNSLILKGLICTIFVNLSYLIIFLKNKEFNYLLKIIKPIIKIRFNKFKVKVKLD